MPRLALSVLVLVPFAQPALGEAAPRLAAPPVVAAGLHATTVGAHAGGDAVEDAVIDAQRAALAAAFRNEGFGPQSPRDIDLPIGINPRVFGLAPDPMRMNLCNIHLHEGAEHRGGEFTDYAGNGDGAGNGTGYRYHGALSGAELAPYGSPVGASAHGALEPGDTIEVHFVFTTARVSPGPTLGACLDGATGNPQLRVEAVVMVLVNDDTEANFLELTQVVTQRGYAQAPNLPMALGQPVVYAGSTTGPSYNETGSPYQVTWSVRPRVLRVSIRSLDAWLGHNVFDEDHAHGVRNLVTDPEQLSPIRY
ncbi:MAG: hypothetical protein KDK12_18900 [Rhodobacteraceae bacterium]|nr:hypothetical protein [Paracoccaceae bacterium]